jgi:hypothetical protein
MGVRSPNSNKNVLFFRSYPHGRKTLVRFPIPTQEKRLILHRQISAASLANVFGIDGAQDHMVWVVASVP